MPSAASARPAAARPCSSRRARPTRQDPSAAKREPRAWPGSPSTRCSPDDLRRRHRRAPVPRADELEHRRVAGRVPRLRRCAARARRMPSSSSGAIGPHAARRVGEDDDPVTGLDVDAQAREEAGHRAAVAGIPRAVDVPHLPAEPVRGGPRLARVVVDRVRLEHLGERVGRQDLAGVAAGEGRPSGRGPRPSSTAGRRGPSRRRRARARAAGRRRRGARRVPWAALPRGAGRRARHAERVEQVTTDHVEPVGAVRPGDELAEGGEADVRVVEAPPGPEALSHQAMRGELVPAATGRALPPRAVRLGLHPGAVREQLGDRRVAERASRARGRRSGRAGRAGRRRAGA